MFFLSWQVTHVHICRQKGQPHDPQLLKPQRLKKRMHVPKSPKKEKMHRTGNKPDSPSSSPMSEEKPKTSQSNMNISFVATVYVELMRLCLQNDPLQIVLPLTHPLLSPHRPNAAGPTCFTRIKSSQECIQIGVLKTSKACFNGCHGSR